MRKKTMFAVTLRRTDTGQTQVRHILSRDQTRATERALMRARAGLPKVVEKYGVRFEVLACKPA
jgi:hypothetical protein